MAGGRDALAVYRLAGRYLVLRLSAARCLQLFAHGIFLHAEPKLYTFSQLGVSIFALLVTLGRRRFRGVL